MNKERMREIRTLTNTGGIIEQLIDALLDEPDKKQPWPGEIAEARLKAEVDQLKTRLQLSRNDVEAITKANNAWQAENRDLTSRVEGLTVERDAARVGLQNKIEECKRLRDDLDATVEIATERGRQCERLGFERDSAIATAQQREQDVSDLRVELAACKEERDGLKAKCGYLYGAPKKMTIIDKINEAAQIEKDNLDTLAKVAAEVAPEIERLAMERGLTVAVFASDEMIDFVMQPKCGTRRLTINAYDDGTLGQSRVDVGGCPSVGRAPLDRSGIADAIAWLGEVPS